MVYNKDSKNESPKEKITMRIIKAKDYDDMSRKAANIMASVITLDPSCTLGLATGSTPIGLYKNLIAAYENGNLDFSKVHSINLDEYKGLSGDNDQSYRYFMNHNLFDHVNIDKANTNVPNGLEPDSDKPARLTMRSSTLQAASTFSCWGLDATAISVSTSPATISRRRLTA